MSGSNDFLRHCEVINFYSAGIAIEEIVLELLKGRIIPGPQIFSMESPYISATPDGFMSNEGIPVEIKTKQHGSINDVIRLHYHQIQFIMYCANSNTLILMACIYNTEFNIVRIH